jgi:ABC-type proline/glycine betaine transport system ATPase subunit
MTSKELSLQLDELISNTTNPSIIEDLQYECLECGKPMERDVVYCSHDCFEAAQL